MPLELVLVSDLHGNLVDIPACDVLVIAGDICPTKNHTRGFQANWLNTTFCDWLSRQPVKQTLAVWGNHDGIGTQPERLRELPWTVLTDQEFVYEGVKFYGLPWQREFGNWAFNLKEHELARKYAAIPDVTDVIISHGPPWGLGDNCQGELLGSPSLTDRILDVEPSLVVCGHIHPGRGVHYCNRTTVVNASLLNDDYRICGKPIRVTYHSHHQIEVHEEPNQ